MIEKYAVLLNFASYLGRISLTIDTGIFRVIFDHIHLFGQLNSTVVIRTQKSLLLSEKVGFLDIAADWTWSIEVKLSS